MRKSILTLIILSIWAVTSYAAYNIVCPSRSINALNQTGQYTIQVNGVNKTTVFDKAYYDNLYNATDCTINQVPDNSVYNVALPSPTPEQTFSKDIFDQELLSNPISADPNMYGYFYAIDRMIDFRNFQGIANWVAGFLYLGKINNTEVAEFDSVMEEQGVNLASYNSAIIGEANVSY